MSNNDTVVKNEEDLDATLRRLDILFLLQSGGCYSSTYLKRRFGVTKPTIAQDISVLMRRYDIQAKKGPNGGYYYTGKPIFRIKMEVYSAVRAVLKRHQDEYGADVEFELLKLDESVDKWNKKQK